MASQTNATLISLMHAQTFIWSILKIEFFMLYDHFKIRYSLGYISGDCSHVRRSTCPKVHMSEGPLVRRFGYQQKHVDKLFICVVEKYKSYSHPAVRPFPKQVEDNSSSFHTCFFSDFYLYAFCKILST